MRPCVHTAFLLATTLGAHQTSCRSFSPCHTGRLHSYNTGVFNCLGGAHFSPNLHGAQTLGCTLLRTVVHVCTDHHHGVSNLSTRTMSTTGPIVRWWRWWGLFYITRCREWSTGVLPPRYGCGGWALGVPSKAWVHLIGDGVADKRASPEVGLWWWWWWWWWWWQ